MGIWTYVIIGIAVALVLLLCLALAIATFSFENYSEKLKQVDAKPNSAGVRTLDYVRSINQNHFQGRLQIAQCPEWFDHYSSGQIALSHKTMSSNSLASLAIVSHELGHARQDASGNTLRKHWKLRRTVKMCGFFFMPLLIVGIVLSLLWVFEVLEETYFLIAGLGCLAGGVAIFLLAVFLKYREVKIEKEASVFALDFLREVLTEPEVKQCQKLLASASLTYWASFIRTLLSWTMLTKNDTFQ